MEVRAAAAAVRRRRAAPRTGVARRPAGCCTTATGGDDGLIRTATIVPPTAQNQAAIEYQMAQLVADNLSLDDVTLTSLCERSIRNHDRASCVRLTS